jgi:hypothetical protein
LYLLGGFLELSASQVDPGQVRIGVVLLGPECDCRKKIGGGLLELLLLEAKDAACKQQGIAGIALGIEAKSILEVFLCLAECPQLLVGEPTEQLGPDEIGSTLPLPIRLDEGDKRRGKTAPKSALVALPEHG